MFVGGSVIESLFIYLLGLVVVISRSRFSWLIKSTVICFFCIITVTTFSFTHFTSWQYLVLNILTSFPLFTSRFTEIQEDNICLVQQEIGPSGIVAAIQVLFSYCGLACLLCYLNNYFKYERNFKKKKLSIEVHMYHAFNLIFYCLDGTCYLLQNPDL